MASLKTELDREVTSIMREDGYYFENSKKRMIFENLGETLCKVVGGESLEKDPKSIDFSYMQKMSLADKIL